jgi:hypothetical protein
MRKIRNPRYAPEFLERKLSPSVTLPAAQVVALETPPATEPPNDPMPQKPTGPVGPARTVDSDRFCLN